MSHFDTGHRINLAHSATFGNTDFFHKKHDRRKQFKNVSNYERIIAECDYHVCVWTRSGTVWDLFCERETMCGNATTADGAFARWKNHLISIGVHAENARRLDGRV